MLRLLMALLAVILSYPSASYTLKGNAVGGSMPGVRERPAGSTSPGLIRSSWGKALNPSGLIPNSGFKAIYFDRRRPDVVVFQENVPDIAIKYAWSDFHDIESPRFSAYWVGKLKFREAMTRQISVSQSWAKTRILIDGQVVFNQSNNSPAFTHHFSRGEHVIEVEYINNWHTVEFKVTLDDPASPITADEVADHFRRNTQPGADLFYVGVYESGAKDTGIDVILPATGRPAVLWLTSYEAIDWRIKSPGRVAAVVVSSHAPGSRVAGVRDARVLRLDKWRAIHAVAKRCSCSAGHFHCEDDGDLDDVAIKLKAVTGLDLAGYAARYSAQALTIETYDDAVAARLSRSKAATLAARNQCTRDASPDFDTMFKR